MSAGRVLLAGGVRTPIGNFGGALAASTAVELGGVAARAALARAGVPAEAVDDVIFGHARRAGNGPNPARQVGAAPGCGRGHSHHQQGLRIGAAGGGERR